MMFEPTCTVASVALGVEIDSHLLRIDVLAVHYTETAKQAMEN